MMKLPLLMQIYNSYQGFRCKLSLFTCSVYLSNASILVFLDEFFILFFKFKEGRSTTANSFNISVKKTIILITQDKIPTVTRVQLPEVHLQVLQFESVITTRTWNLQVSSHSHRNLKLQIYVSNLEYKKYQKQFFSSSQARRS